MSSKPKSADSRLTETETSETMGRDVAQPPSEYGNGLDAAASGAADGMKLSLNILAMLIAFLGLLGVINALIGGVWSGHDLQGILGTIFAPFAWLIGVPASEMMDVGRLLGFDSAADTRPAIEVDLGDGVQRVELSTVLKTRLEPEF